MAPNKSSLYFTVPRSHIVQGVYHSTASCHSTTVARVPWYNTIVLHGPTELYCPQYDTYVQYYNTTVT